MTLKEPEVIGEAVNEWLLLELPALPPLVAHVFDRSHYVMRDIQQLDGIGDEGQLDRVPQEEPVVVHQVRAHHLLPVLHVLVGELLQRAEDHCLSH